MADEEIRLKISIDGAERELGNIQSLRDAVSELEENLENAEFGSEAFKRSAAELKKARGELFEFDKQLEGLQDPVKSAEKWVKFGEGVAGAFAAAQGAALLFGVESENVEKLVAKAQGATAIAVGARALAESRLFTILKNTTAGKYAAIVAEKAYALAIGTSTGLLKLFRIALVSTGLGAIAVALGVVVANWDKWKDSILNAVKAFLKFNPATAAAYALFQKFKGPLKAVAENLGLVATEAEKAARKLVELAEATGEETAKQYQRQIDLAKAKGEETVDLERESLEEQLKIAEAGYNAIGNTGKKYTDEEIKEAKDRYEDLAFQLEVFNATQQRLKEEAAEKDLELARKAAIEQRKIFQEQNEAVLELADLVYEELNKEGGYFNDFLFGQDEDKAREETSRLLRERMDHFKETMQDRMEEDVEDEEMNLGSFFERRLELIRQGYNNEEALAIATSERINEIEAQRAEARNQLISASLGAIDSLISASGKNGKAAQRLQKVLALAQIAYDAGKSISGVIAAATAAAAPLGPGAPFAIGPYIAQGLAVVLPGIASAYAALKKAPDGGGGGGGISAPSIPTVQPPQFQIPEEQERQASSQGSESAFGMPVFKTYVLETDVSSSLEARQRVEDIATFRG